MALFFVSCASEDIPVKTVHPETENSTTPTPAANLPDSTPAPTQASSQDSSKAPSTSTPTAPQHYEDLQLSDLELQKYAYELGFNPKAELTNEQKQQIVDRTKLRELERALDSQQERLQYSKVLPWLNGDKEKIELLSIPSVEGRQVWINKNKIWSRIKEMKNYDDVVEAQDIALGMPADYVRKSWGEPTSIEVSGNPIYKNERWQYLRQVSTPQGYRQERRYVYFEGGRVVGWETE